MFRGEKIQLTAIQRDNLPKYVEWLNDWEVAQFLAPGIPRPLRIEDEADWFDRVRTSDRQLVFAIVTLAENKLIGNCGLHDIDLKNRSASFGIFIGDRNYWGKGYGTDATKTILRYGFEQLGLNHIELWVYAFNPRAIRSYEKSGFKREGVRRQGLYRNGKFHDEYLMGILREDWEKTK